MNNKLKWKVVDMCQLVSVAHGIKYRIFPAVACAEGQCLYLHLPNDSISGKKIKWSIIADDLKKYAQAHHDAICNIVEETRKEAYLAGYHQLQEDCALKGEVTE